MYRFYFIHEPNFRKRLFDSLVHDSRYPKYILRGYSLFYVVHISNHYIGLILILWDKYCPIDVYNDPYGWFLVADNNRQRFGLV